MSRTWIQALVAAQLLCVLAGLLPACTEKTPCDEGQVLRDGYCFPVTDSGASGGGFGEACATTAECAAPTVYCAVQPGQAAGFCTAFGCDVDTTVCPSGWGCMDLTPYGMAQHMCIPSPADAAVTPTEAAVIADAATPADAAVPDDDAIRGEAGEASAFGKACTAPAECVAPTMYCAMQPGQPAGYCTVFGCDLDASVCPSGWGCMDLTPFGLAQHMCIPPA